MKSSFTFSLAVVLLFVHLALSAQSNIFSFAGKQNGNKYIPYVESYQQVQINKSSLKHFLLNEVGMEYSGKSAKINLPMPDGKFSTFDIVESPVMEAELAAKYSDIKTFRASSPTMYARLMISDRTIQIFINSPEGDILLEHLYDDQFALFNSNAIKLDETLPVLSCGTHDLKQIIHRHSTDASLLSRTTSVNPVDLRTYRLALSSTAEWTNSASLGGGTVASALDKMVQSVNILNANYEKDFAIHVNLINNNDRLIYTDENTDPFDNPTVGMQIIPLNTFATNQRIGSRQYDYGHVFTIGCSDVGGVASLAGVCNSEIKGSAVTCWYTSDIAYVCNRIMCHEMGHQFSATHTFSNCNGNESGASAWEPGSGTTIMSYGGLCGNGLNVITGAPPHPNFFHSGSVEQVYQFTRIYDGKNCGSSKTTTNSPPVAEILSPSGLTIPANTPFRLKGKGSDETPSALTYSWEQFNPGSYGPQLGQPSLTEDGPLFQVLFPSNNPERIFPNWLAIINTDNYDRKEVLPSVTRGMKFRFIVRDNFPGSGGVDYKDISFDVLNTGSAFAITYPTKPGDKLFKNSCNLITWDVAKSDRFPINCKKVNILLYTKRDWANPIMLKANTDNDGSEIVSIPDLPNDNTARIEVASVDNIFFDVSNDNVELQAADENKILFSINPLNKKICLPEVINLDISTCAQGNFNGTVNAYVESGLPNGSTANFSKTSFNNNDNGKLELNLNNLTRSQEVNIVVAGISNNGDTIRQVINLDVVKNDFADQALLSPVNGLHAVKTIPTFNWNPSVNAQYYDFELASSVKFGNTIIFSQRNLTKTSLTPSNIKLNPNTLYFWRIIPYTSCGQGNPSQIFIFQTENKTCSQIDYPGNPDIINANSTKTFSTPVSINGIISDLNIINVDIDAIQVNDISFTIISPIGKKCNLFNYNCGNTDKFECSFDDDAVNSIVCPPIRGVAMKPVEQLSIYKGDNIEGVWNFEISSKKTLQYGQFYKYSLEYCAELKLNPPFLVNNLPLKLDIKQNKTIDNILLLSQDNDNTAVQLKYTLVSIPLHGKLLINGIEADYGSTFTQKDINDNKISYAHTGTDNDYDGFNFIVEDGTGGWFGSDFFQILVGTVATQNPKNELDFNLYPNPSQGKLYINVANSNPGKTMVRIYNIQGVEVVKSNMAISNSMEIELQELENGIYFVELSNGQHKVIKKLNLLK